MRRLRRVLTLGVVGALGLGLLGLSGSASEAQAAEFYPVPAGGVYTIDGHGYGHGHGMSQYGAQGAALAGRNVWQILDFYYPGTVNHDIGNPVLRVQLERTTVKDIRIDPSPGQTVMAIKNVATGALVKKTATAYRVVTTGTSQQVLAYTNPGWAAVASTTSSTGFYFNTYDGASVHRTDGIVRNYRGGVQTVLTASDRVTAVNHVTMEDYLRGVVPRESPASWKPAALEAQAVAARSYAWYDVAVASGGAWDLCDTTSCQVYAGRTEFKNGGWVSVEQTSTNSAIDATARQARYYNGAPAFTQFSSSNGGVGSDGGKPYLTNFTDPYDGTPSNPNHDWTVTMSAASLEAKYPSLGRLSGIRINARSGLGEWGGYITSMELVGSQNTVSVSARLGLKSTYWKPRSQNAPFGDLNSAVVTGGSVRLTGWSIDPDTAASTQVHVYVGGKWGGSQTASVPRPDVAAVYPDKGAAHGFDLTVQAGPGTHEICVYGINLGAGTENTRIGCTSVNMGKAPIGRLDKALLTAGQIRLVGWTLDPDTVDPIDAHVYVNGRFAKAVVADLSRPDVGQVYPASGSRHGFDTTVGLTPGTNKVCVFGMDVPTRNGNPQVGCATVTFGAPPKGDLNSATVSGSTARLVGWALDPDTVDPIQVHVYVDGRYAKAASAAVARPDIGAAFPAYGSRHGFDVSVGLTTGRHSVCVFAIDVGGQKNPQLGCATLTVGSAAVAAGQLPIGNIDSSSVSGNVATVGGWALDKDLPTQPIEVHVYVDGRWTRAVTASARRGDIATAFPTAGSAHGWSTQLGMTPGTHRVCAYGINVGGGSSNPLLRCVDVRVP